MESKIIITINNGHLSIDKENINESVIPRIFRELADEVEKVYKQRNPEIKDIEFKYMETENQKDSPSTKVGCPDCGWPEYFMIPESPNRGICAKCGTEYRCDRL